MKNFGGVITVVLAVFLISAQGQEDRFCDASGQEDLSDMKKTCVDEVKAQILQEVKASVAYLSMGAHFSKDTVNLPGFAKTFFESAKEEREHAMHLIHYLTMRGELASNSSGFIEPITVSVEPMTGLVALQKALSLEKHVTKSIRKVIEVCEDENENQADTERDPNAFNDYHLVDYLTGVYLEEQYKGQRELAGKSVTLQNMMRSYGEMGVFMFDKTLL